MPSDALEQPSNGAAPALELVTERGDEPLDEALAEGLAEVASEIRFGPEQGVYISPISPGRTFELPAGVAVHASVELDLPDPALTDAGRRVCIAATQAGSRCRAPAITELVLCSAHAGRLDSSAGGRARADQQRKTREDAENRAIEGRMGARGIIAAALREKGPELRLAIHSLADRAAAGDRQAALAIIPFMTQALGAPSSTPTEVQVEGESVDLSTLDTASLKALLGR